jgi:hypothetical protein
LEDRGTSDSPSADDFLFPFDETETDASDLGFSFRAVVGGVEREKVVDDCPVTEEDEGGASMAEDSSTSI